MKRFHLHLHVTDLAANIGFYSKLFSAEPARIQSADVALPINPTDACC